jgi:pSer/pThr/pTyr-binding forkhead associated (FHA) protein
LSGALKHRKVLLLANRTIVGRGRSCHVRLPDSYVSNEHLALERREDGVWVEDLGSSNGSHVNSSALTAPRRLADGDRLRFGRTEAEFRCPTSTV